MNYVFFNMIDLNQIKSSLSESKTQLFKQYPIKSLAIFGSYSKGTSNEHSDLDILVEFSGKIGIRFIDLAQELETLTGLKVDLVSRKGMRDKYFNAIKSDLIYV